MNFLFSAWLIPGAPDSRLAAVTLTEPLLSTGRKRLWGVTGIEKAAVLERLIAGDRSIPAGRINWEDSLLIIDQAASSSPRT